MARLNKLSIVGIRSYSPDTEEVQTITFGNPVTLILGQNGSGKTTIIEALKYACSGELPSDCSHGQGFINDPKITNKLRVRGQIKLKIIDVNGKEVLFWHAMEVTQNASKLKFERKSSAIKIIDEEGEEHSISGRCADVNAQCCQILNTTPTILTNVIFCHQEASLWPLDEGKKLKEKFDQIFESDKHDKCSDLLRVEILKRTNELKIKKTEYQHYKDLKNRLEDTKARLEDKKDKLKLLNNKIKDNEEAINPIDNRIKAICDIENILAELQRKLAQQEEKKKGIIEQQNLLKRSIKFIYDGSDDELEKIFSTFDKNKANEEEIIKKLTERKSEIEDKILKINGKIQELQINIGKLEEEKSRYEKKCTERDELLGKANQQIGIEMDTKNPNYCVNLIRDEYEKAQKQFNVLIEELDVKEKHLQKVIDEIRGKHLNARHQINSRREEIKKSNKKKDEINQELNNFEDIQSKLNFYDHKIKTNDEAINSLNQQLNVDEIEREKMEKKHEIEKKEKEINEIEKEIKILQKNENIEERLEMENEVINKKQMEIKSLKLKNLDNFKALFNDNVPEENFQEKIEDIKEEKNEIFNELNKKTKDIQSSITKLETKQHVLKEQIKKYEDDLEKKQNEINLVCCGNDFNEILNTSSVTKERLQRDKGQYSSAKIMYEKFIKEFETEKPCCPVCQTDFAEKKEMTREIIVTIRKKIETIPKMLAECEENLKKEEERYDKLQQLKPLYDDVNDIKTKKLPKLNQELNEVNKELEGKNKILDQLKFEIELPKKQLEICQKLVTDAVRLDQNLIEKGKSEKLMKNLKQEIIELPSKRTRIEAEAEVDSLKEQIIELRNSIEALTGKVTKHNKRRQELIEERGSLLEKKVNIEKAITKIPMLRRQNEELIEKNQELEKEIKVLEKDERKLQQELTSATKSKEDAEIENKELIKKEREKVEKIKEIYENLKKLQGEINAYIDKKGNEILNRTIEELKQYKTNETTLKNTRNQLIEEITKKREELAKNESNYRAYQDNITLRQKEKEVIQLSEEINKLKEKIGSHNYRTLYEEKKQLEKQRENCQKELNNMLGQRDELEKHIKEMENDLKKPENINIYKNYRSKYYEVIVGEEILNDIKIYREALDNAIIDFHKTKIIEINKTIKKYWTDIYRGNDIDYIEIKTESSKLTGKRQTYNYKVVQVKNGVELEMRGRCSAGQKVLACLIIRMALSETFSSNCGILALDEPTTNLDRDNIDSLSMALAQIIQTRSEDQNFQLIIITHDEEFINTLTRMYHIPHFYEISRNVNGFSQVKIRNQ